MHINWGRLPYAALQQSWTSSPNFKQSVNPLLGYDGCELQMIWGGWDYMEVSRRGPPWAADGPYTIYMQHWSSQTTSAPLWWGSLCDEISVNVDDDDNVGDDPDDLRPLILVLRYEGLSLMIFYIYVCVCTQYLWPKVLHYHAWYSISASPISKGRIWCFLQIRIQNNDEDEDPY